jgi:hypothetical protein
MPPITYYAVPEARPETGRAGPPCRFLSFSPAPGKGLQRVGPFGFDTQHTICETQNCCRSGGFTRSTSCAEVAELADAHGSGPCTRKGVGVRVPSSAPILSESVIYSHGVHHGVHKTAGLVSIVVSTSPRLFARVLRRTDNRAHATPSGQFAPRSTSQHSQEGSDRPWVASRSCWLREMLILRISLCCFLGGLRYRLGRGLLHCLSFLFRRKLLLDFRSDGVSVHLVYGGGIL